MPTQHNMKMDDVLYRGIFAYDYQPTEVVDNPHFDPLARNDHPMYMKNEMWRRYINVNSGPVERREFVRGPVTNPSALKGMVKRWKSQYKNLELVRIEQATQWEEVEI